MINDKDMLGPGGCGVSTVAMDELEALRAAFPAWHVWKSSAGRYWATRRGQHRFSKDMHPQWAMTVDGDTEQDIRAAVEKQDGFDPDIQDPSRLLADWDEGRA